MKKTTGLLLAAMTLATQGVQAENTDLICSMDEINTKTNEVTQTTDVKVSVPDQSSRNVRALTYYNSDRIVEQWEITPTHSNYRYRKMVGGDIIKTETSSIEAVGYWVACTMIHPLTCGFVDIKRRRAPSLVSVT